jgi:hypothetical protein
MTMIFHLSRVIDAGGLMDAGGPPGESFLNLRPITRIMITDKLMRRTIHETTSEKVEISIIQGLV